MMRIGSVIKVPAGQAGKYIELHKNVWKPVLRTIKECNIRNYSIFYKDEYLFSYYEYTGSDYEADMKKMAEDPITQEWWKLCRLYQTPLETRKDAEWWAGMKEVFHLE